MANMFRRTNSCFSVIDFMKKALRNIVLYFIYFFTLLFWLRLIGVNAQGNRGVIINNQKFDDSSGIHYKGLNTSIPTVPAVLQTPHVTTTKKPTTLADAIITIKDFQSQTTKPTIYRVKSTILPILDPDTKRPSKQPQNLSTLLKIDNILKQKTNDTQKVNEIIRKLNRIGHVSRVSGISTTKTPTKIKYKTSPMPSQSTKRRNITYASEIENLLKNDHQKDSKELKVQFVLDCDLKDMNDKTKTSLVKPLSIAQQPTTGVKKLPVQYPTFYSAFNQNRIPTKAPVKQSTLIYYFPTKKVATTSKPRVKNVYVDPPLVAELSDTFENVYNFFENKLTTKVKVKPRKEAKKRPIKRSTAQNHIAAPTIRPNYQYTQAYGPNGQKLTTNIHVTSEFVGKDPEEPEPIKKPGESESDESDDYSEGFFDDYESDSDDRDDDDDEDEDDYSIGGSDYDDDDEYDEDEDTDEDVYDGPPPNKVIQSKSSKKRGKRKPSKKQSDEDAWGGLSMFNMGKYVQKTYNSFTDYMPAMPSFFGSDDYDEDDENDGSQKRKPKFKLSAYSKRNPLSRIDIEEKKNNRWYDKFFFGSEEESITSPTPATTTTQAAGFFNWLGEDTEETTEKAATEQTSEHNWFSGLFSNKATTTAAKPESLDTTTATPSNTIDPKKWFQMLSAHMATMDPTPTSSTMNRTNVLKRVKYNDYQVWRILPSTQAHLEFLREYKDSDEDEKVLWLKGPAMRGPNDVLIPPDMNKEIQELLEYESIPYEVVVWDLEKAIKYENPIMSRRQKIELEKEQGHPMTWYRYHNFEDIAIYLDYLQLTYPDLVELIHLGRSFEGRPLMVVKVSFDATEAELQSIPKSTKKTRPSLKTRRKKKVYRPAVFIEAGVHGREWITPAVATWILRELVKHNATENGNTEKEILRSVDWYIMPVSNPDGYEYSLNYDRLWRKTRSRIPESESMLKLALNWLKRDSSGEAQMCYGADPDRNYNVDWQKYGSASACSEFYAGSKPLSEPETKALASFLDDNKKSINLFVSLQSYGQFITYPSTVNSTFDTSQRSNDLRDMAEVAVNALRDLASSGRYSVDNTNEMSSLKSGTSADYAMQNGIKYSYTVQLRDTGTQGFLLSPSYIDSTGLEAYEMIKAMVDFI